MRSFEQREFVPLFHRQKEPETRSESSESAPEISHALLSLAKSIEILAGALLRADPDAGSSERSRCTALVRASAVDQSLELDD